MAKNLDKPNNIRLTPEDHLVNGFSTFFAFIVFLLTVYPIYYCTIYAFSDGKSALAHQIYFWPVDITLANFKAVLEDNLLVNSFLLSVARTALSALTCVSFTALTAYALTKKQLAGRKIYSMIAMFTMYFVGGLIPTYLWLRNLKLINTFAVYIIPSLLNVYHMLLFMAFFSGIVQRCQHTYIRCWGVEGKKEDGWSGDVVNGPHSYFDENGKATYYEGFQAARNADWSGVERKSGIGFYQSYICTNSIYITEAEVIKSELMTQMNEWYRDKVTYNNGFIFNIPAGSDEYVTYQTINSLIEEYNVKWAYAKDEEEVRKLYDEFIKKVEASGESKLNDWYTKTYKENIK